MKNLTHEIINHILQFEGNIYNLSKLRLVSQAFHIQSTKRIEKLIEHATATYKVACSNNLIVIGKGNQLFISFAYGHGLNLSEEMQLNANFDADSEWYFTKIVGIPEEYLLESINVFLEGAFLTFIDTKNKKPIIFSFGTLSNHACIARPDLKEKFTIAQPSIYKGPLQDQVKVIKILNSARSAYTSVLLTNAGLALTGINVDYCSFFGKQMNAPDFSYLETKFSCNFIYKKTATYGHCLHNAVAMHFKIDQQTLRNAVASQIRNEPNEYQSLINGLESYFGRTIDEYIKDLEIGKEWDDNLEIKILMKALNRKIIVINSNCTIRNLSSIENELGIIFDNDPIFLHYNEYNNQYDVLIHRRHRRHENIMDLLDEFKQNTLNLNSRVTAPSSLYVVTASNQPIIIKGVDVNSIEKVSVSMKHLICLLSNGELLGCGSNYQAMGFRSKKSRINLERIFLPEQFNNDHIIDVATTTEYSFILLKSGKIICFDGSEYDYGNNNDACQVKYFALQPIINSASSIKKIFISDYDPNEWDSYFPTIVIVSDDEKVFVSELNFKDEIEIEPFYNNQNHLAFKELKFSTNERKKIINVEITSWLLAITVQEGNLNYITHLSKNNFLTKLPLPKNIRNDLKIFSNVNYNDGAFKPQKLYECYEHPDLLASAGIENCDINEIENKHIYSDNIFCNDIIEAKLILNKHRLAP